MRVNVFSCFLETELRVGSHVSQPAPLRKLCNHGESQQFKKLLVTHDGPSSRFHCPAFMASKTGPQASARSFHADSPAFRDKCPPTQVANAFRRFIGKLIRVSLSGALRIHIGNPKTLSCSLFSTCSSPALCLSEGTSSNILPAGTHMELLPCNRYIGALATVSAPLRVSKCSLQSSKAIPRSNTASPSITNTVSGDSVRSRAPCQAMVSDWGPT